jgi:hypothetical protein
MIDIDTGLTTVERNTWETPAMVRLDTADAEGMAGGDDPDGVSGMGMQAS